MRLPSRNLLAIITIIVVIALIPITIRVLYPPARIYGRIVDEHGLPIAGAKVGYSIESHGLMWSYSTRGVVVETDKNGDYCMSDLKGSIIQMGGVKLGDRVLSSAMGNNIPTRSWTMHDPSSVATLPRRSSQRITYAYKRPWPEAYPGEKAPTKVPGLGEEQLFKRP